MKSTPPPNKLPSNRKFGWFFSLVFFALAASAFWRNSIFFEISLFALLSIAFAITAAINPKALTLLNRLWYEFGLILGRIVSPIVLGLIFFALLTPIALLARAFGRDELRLKKRSVESYWVDRAPPGPSSDSFKNQF